MSAGIRKKCLAIAMLLAGISQSMYGNMESLGVNGQQCCEPLKEDTLIGFLKADLLYWVPQIGGMEFDFGTTSVVKNVINDVTITNTDELDLDPSFKWNAGFRLGMGFDMPCSQVGFAAFWTNFGSDAKNVSGHGTDHGKWKVTFNQFDVLTGYKAKFGACRLEPFIGLRGARIQQKIDAVLSIDTTISDDFYVELVTLDNHQTFWGIGPEIGLNADCDLGCGFGAFGSIATSIMYGNFKTNFNNSDISPLSQVFSETKQHVNARNAAVDIVLGLRWKEVFCDDIVLMFELAGEHHQYFNQNYLGSYGDLSFDGVTFSFGIAL